MNRSRVRFHLRGSDVASAYEVTRQQSHRGAPAPAGRLLLQRGLRVSQPSLLHNALSDEGYLPVEEEEAGHTVPSNQAELLFQTLLDSS